MRTLPAPVLSGLLVGLTAFGALTAFVPATAARAATPSATALDAEVPRYDHVVVVFLENEDATGTFEDATAAPHLAALERQGSYVPNYWGVGHASLDNYIAVFGGEQPTTDSEADCLGMAVANCTYPATVPTLGSSLDAAGRSWKVYSEGMAGVPGTGGDCLHQAQADLPDAYQGPGTNGYATRHNPAMWYASVIDKGADATGSSTYCQAHSVDYTALAKDEQSGTTLPSFSFVEPDTCHDGHDAQCTGDPEGPTSSSQVATLDSWLPTFTGPLLSSPAWQTGNNLLVITFDEAISSGASADTTGCTSCADGSAGGRIGALFVGSGVKQGYTSTWDGDHYGLLRTIEDSQGLPTLLKSQAAGATAASTVHDGDAAVTPVTDVFIGTPAVDAAETSFPVSVPILGAAAAGLATTVVARRRRRR